MKHSKPRFNPTTSRFVERKPDFTINHTGSIPFIDLDKTPLCAYTWSPSPSLPFDYTNATDSLKQLPLDTRLFLDTGFLTSHEMPSGFCQELIKKNLFLVPGVVDELQPWLRSPKCNSFLRDFIASAIETETQGGGHATVSIASMLDLSPEFSSVAIHYWRLLGLRKHLAKALHEQASANTPQNSFQAEFQHFFGDRAWRIAKKAIDPDKATDRLIDEAIVVNAVFHSILFQVPVIILTRDNDVFEQFYKLIYLIDTHHASMELAARFLRSPERFLSYVAPAIHSDAFHSIGATLIEQSDVEIRERTAPDLFTECTCRLLSTSNSPTMQSRISFGVPADYQRVIRMKVSARGKNTDLFGDFNFHIQIDPLKNHFKSAGAAFVRDKHLNFETALDIPIAVTDAELALFTHERFCQLAVSSMPVVSEE